MVAAVAAKIVGNKRRAWVSLTGILHSAAFVAPESCETLFSLDLLRKHRMSRV